jgi:hypothetical protein
LVPVQLGGEEERERGTGMNTRGVNIVLAVIFLVVGILATANTFRLNSYIHETLPRDTAQEACNTATIKVLKSWIQSRIERDSAMDARDDAAVAALEGILTNPDGRATPEQIQAWRDAVANDRQVRASAGEQRVPLPNC